ncbi:MAG: pssZ, partial [Phenylobacterium sp.]|uniref:sugar transferase n=1 Tax=Phenylobacterium sp. TaxID=1871053 RepID=UPI00261610AB
MKSVVSVLAGEGDVKRRLTAAPDRVRAARNSLVHAVATDPLKRLFDILAAGFGLLLFLPLLAVVVLAIRIESPGGAIFRQRRTGYRGEVFTIYKF